MADLIHLLDHKVRLFQPEQGFRTSQDAVLLAAACPAQGTQSVLDLGCGVGGASFCLLWREENLALTGIDIEPLYLDLARKNAELNHKHATFLHADTLHYRVDTPAQRFDHIICNPPFFQAGEHTASPILPTAAARGYLQDNETLEGWIKSAFENLVSKGSLTLIHQADKTDEIIRFLGKKFRSTEIIPIYTKPNEPAKRVIIRSFKDRKSPCTLHPGITLHRPDRSLTASANRLLRDGATFETVLKEMDRL
ncbi:MAG: methyltransferase [Rhodospirillales bacterium]|nr:methyltransferase [Rhodospirillales bacterium]